MGWGRAGEDAAHATGVSFKIPVCINFSFPNTQFFQFPVAGATFLFIAIVLAFFPISSKTHLNPINLILIWWNRAAKNPPAEERLVVCVHRERTSHIHLAVWNGMPKGKRLGLLYTCFLLQVFAGMAKCCLANKYPLTWVIGHIEHMFSSYLQDMCFLCWSLLGTDPFIPVH